MLVRVQLTAQLSMWCSGQHPPLSRERPGFNSRHGLTFWARSSIGRTAGPQPADGSSNLSGSNSSLGDGSLRVVTTVRQTDSKSVRSAVAGSTPVALVFQALWCNGLAHRSHTTKIAGIHSGRFRAVCLAGIRDGGRQVDWISIAACGCRFDSCWSRYQAS